MITLAGQPGLAGEALVAVAANFAEPARAIGAAFTAKTGHRATFSIGATGQLYTQITQGAPYEVFLAADQERPRRAAAEGLAIESGVFTYAVGRLALYSVDPDRVTGPDALDAPDLRRLALANPATAPYGAAAIETMDALGVHGRLRRKIVQGANVGQTFQFVATGAAELGFVALSQVRAHGGGSHWLVPRELHRPIAQDGALLKAGENDEAARAFIAFLRGPEAGALIAAYGYDRPGGNP